MYKSSKRARLDLNDNEFGSAQNDAGLLKQLVLFNKQPSLSNGEESSQSPATPQSVQPPDIEIIEQEEAFNNVVTSPFLDNNTNNNNDPILVSRQESITNEQVTYQEWRQHFDGIVRSHVYASEIIDLVKSASKDLDLALASLNSYFDRNSNRVDFADMEYRTPLMHSSHVEVTQLLIDKGANVNLRDANGRTAIMYAPNAQIARVLIANRADLNFRDANGQTALMHAINRPHPQLKSTANSEHYLNTYTRNYSATNSNQNNQEWLMSVYDRMELIRLLIRSVTTHNINLFDKSYSNALLLAVKANDIDTVRMLVPYGADINSGDQFGRTPLMHAVLLNNLDIVRLLIDNNVNVNHIDNAYKSTLLYAFESCPKVCNEVCNDSCTCNSLNPTSRLQRALNKSILDEIIEKSSIEMINYKNPNDQKPPLIHAVLLNDIATVQALIRRGAFVNQTDQWRNTPLIYAILRKQVLLENNADVNAIGFAEKTPLMIVYNLEKTQSNRAPTIQHYHQHLQQQQQLQVEPVQQQTNRGRGGRGRGRPRLITLAPTNPPPTPQYNPIFRQPSQNQDIKTKIYELAETILRHCSRQAESIGVCTLLNLDSTGEEPKTVVDCALESDDKRNMQTLMYYSIGSVYHYFYSSTPDMIRAHVNKYIESVRPKQACQTIAADNSSSLLFPLQYAHFQLFERLSLFIESNLEDDVQFHDFCLEYYYLIYFISVDFQEKLLSDVMIRLSEDLIEIDKFTTLDAKRNLLITDDIVIEEESNEINAFASDLKTKREIVEGIFNRITSFTPVILKMANWLIKPTVPFESSFSDEYSFECEKFLKTRPFSKNLF